MDVAALTLPLANLILSGMTQQIDDRRNLLAVMQAQQALVSNNVRTEIIADLAKGRRVTSVVDGKLVHELVDNQANAADTELPAATV
ncbi:hypothetical protein [Sandarakinorhabdus sp.]|uniref:hypothetical protein n=1 Tax=Sandarakinorhabdus sp. TaxID=1916663 RepID=UPI003F6FD772